MAPQDGVPVEIWPGVLWIRLSLPYRLNHVNVYLIDDGNGWALIDTGLGDAKTEEVWKNLFTGVLDRALTRIIVTHYHPDHVGMAGWIAQHFNIPVYMSETEYLMSRNIQLDPGALEAEHYLNFYMNHGLDADEARRLVTQGHSYLKIVRALPPTFRRLCAGDELPIGKRKFLTLTGAGHSPEQVFLYCESEKIFLSADQVLNRISPNVSVSAVDPDGDPLGLYLRSLMAIAACIPDDVLVLPGHDMPFYKLHGRIAELIAHHDQRCDLIIKACRTSPKSVAELVPYIFHRNLGPHETGFAFSEVLAHVNYLQRRQQLESIVEQRTLARTFRFNR
jgi:glyoxylase-like metal-dependent hydrolase (beta-lactamase superfamily II)